MLKLPEMGMGLLWMIAVMQPQIPQRMLPALVVDPTLGDDPMGHDIPHMRS